jgi:hypothetical protein
MRHDSGWMPVEQQRQHGCDCRPPSGSPAADSTGPPGDFAPHACLYAHLAAIADVPRRARRRITMRLAVANGRRPISRSVVGRSTRARTRLGVASGIASGRPVIAHIGGVVYLPCELRGAAIVPAIPAVLLAFGSPVHCGPGERLGQRGDPQRGSMAPLCFVIMACPGRSISQACWRPSGSRRMGARPKVWGGARDTKLCVLLPPLDQPIILVLLRLSESVTKRDGYARGLGLRRWTSLNRLRGHSQRRGLSVAHGLA